ncbi:MAG: hypothetical protein WB607_17560 [Candidatus Acidiferrum sp.]
MNAYGSHANWLESTAADVPSRPFTAFGRWTSNLLTGGSTPLTNSGRWRRAIFDFPTPISFQRIDDSFVTRGVSIDVKNDTLVLGSGSSI